MQKRQTKQIAGMIDFFKARGGKVGVDACVRPAAFHEMMQLSPCCLSYINMGAPTANYSFEGRVSHATAKQLAKIAKQHGVAIHR